jgi:hypothetical protein
VLAEKTCGATVARKPRVKCRRRTLLDMITKRSAIRRTAAAAALVLVASLGAGPASAVTTKGKPKTKLVCKTVKGKRTCTRIKIKSTPTTKKSNATDTTIASKAADTTIAPATAAPTTTAKPSNAQDTVAK